MAEASHDKYSAGEQGLGYIYQGRLALYQMLQLPERTVVFLEKDDDVDFEDGDGGKSLASLKHKAEGERLTDLSMDFWKSVRIWLVRYKRDDRAKSTLRFFLFTTAKVGGGSFLTRFLPDFVADADDDKCRFQKTAALNVRSRLHYSSGGVGSIRQRRAAAGHQRTQGGLSATGRSMRHRWPSRRGSESARIDLRCPTSH